MAAQKPKQRKYRNETDTLMEKEYVEKIYDKLHQIPETAFNEYKTSKYIIKQLKKLNYKIETVPETGIIATLDSMRPGTVLGIRADIDALPFSIDGKIVNIHACAHDANTAMVLAMAKEISETGIDKGKLVLLFQPAEEELGGAESLIKSGKLSELDELIGIHLRPIQEAALGEATPALLHGGGSALNVRIRGVAAHGARPHLGISTLDAAVAAVNVVNSIRVSPQISHSIKVTKIQSEGSAPNIIPDVTNLVFDIRAQNNSILDELLKKAKKAVIETAGAFGAAVELDHDGTPAAEYDDELVKDTSNAIKAVFGKVLPPLITPGCEDFHFYSKKLDVKTAYIGLGANLHPGLHHPEMSFDPEALTHGRDILKTIVHSKLMKNIEQ
jgi:amidohydrolase